MKYVEKLETRYNLKLNNHTKDVTKKDNILASNCFDIEGHNFNETCIYMYMYVYVTQQRQDKTLSHIYDIYAK